MSNSQSDFVSPPCDVESATANDFRVRLFTTGTTHAANAVPDSWQGQYVYAIATVDTYFAFSFASNAEVDRSVTSTAAGASAKVGGLLTANVGRFFYLPVRSGQTLYFVRESASSGDVRMERSSG